MSAPHNNTENHFVVLRERAKQKTIEEYTTQEIEERKGIASGVFLRKVCF
jgi:hypothetical protein